jgi:hypothetical protein
MDEHLIGEVNEIYERYIFNKKVQRKGETIDAFVTVLHDLAKNCHFDDLHDSLIRDRIVIGIIDTATRQKLLSTKKLKLEDAIDIARAREATNTQLQEMDNTDNTEEVHAFGKKSDHRKRPEVKECKFCGKSHIMQKSECPAWGKTCGKCGEYNHFSLKCFNDRQKPAHDVESCHKRRSNVHMLHESADEDVDGYADEYEPVYSVEDINMVAEDVNTVIADKLFAKMQIEGSKTVNFQIDCGATVNILPLKTLESLSQPPNPQYSDTVLKMYNGATVKPAGKVRCKTVNLKNGRKYMVEFQVVAGDCKPILGARAVQSMGLISLNTENILAVTANALADTFSHVFDDDLGKFDGKVDLKIDASVPQVKLPPRKLPLAIKDDVKEHIDDLVKKGVLLPVNTPTDWASSMVVVRKDNGTIRLCIDPKPLNMALKRNHYPLPTLNDVLPELSKAKFFTVADVRNGYWHCQLTEESSYMTTFSTPFGRYRWARLPFGLKPAGEEFQRKLCECLEGLEGVEAVADDILVWGETEAEHDQH